MTFPLLEPKTWRIYVISQVMIYGILVKVLIPKREYIDTNPILHSYVNFPYVYSTCVKVTAGK